MNHYAVSYSTAGYYKEKLEQSGYGECLEASAAAARASEAAPVKQSRKKKLMASGKATAWESYCKAYVKAGELVRKGCLLYTSDAADE